MLAVSSPHISTVVNVWFDQGVHRLPRRRQRMRASSVTASRAMRPTPIRVAEVGPGTPTGRTTAAPAGIAGRLGALGAFESRDGAVQGRDEVVEHVEQGLDVDVAGGDAASVVFQCQQLDPDGLLELRVQRIGGDAVPSDGTDARCRRRNKRHNCGAPQLRPGHPEHSTCRCESDGGDSQRVRHLRGRILLGQRGMGRQV
jgi:hypothetical protein